MSVESNRHLDEERIERYLLRDFSEEELAAWDEHLLVCEGCRRGVSETEPYFAAMRHAAGEVRRKVLIKERRSWPSLPGLIPVLAGLALVVLVAVSLHGGWLRTRSTSPVAVALTVSRGPEIEAIAPAGSPLNLRPDLTAVPAWPSYRLEMVDHLGTPVWRGSFPRAAAARPVSPGIYFVRLYSPQGELYREYALRVENRR